MLPDSRLALQTQLLNLNDLCDQHNVVLMVLRLWVYTMRDVASALASSPIIGSEVRWPPWKDTQAALREKRGVYQQQTPMRACLCAGPKAVVLTDILASSVTEPTRDGPHQQG